MPRNTATLKRQLFLFGGFDKRRIFISAAMFIKYGLKQRILSGEKSKSFCMLVFVVETDQYLVPLCVYFKGDREDITKKEINEHLEIIIFEFRMEKMIR